MIAGIVDILILVLVFGYCTYLICKKYQDKKNGKKSCMGCSGCGGACTGCTTSLRYQKEKNNKLESQENLRKTKPASKKRNIS